jgi:hypothetical protein
VGNRRFPDKNMYLDQFRLKERSDGDPIFNSERVLFA